MERNALLRIRLRRIARLQSNTILSIFLGPAGVATTGEKSGREEALPRGREWPSRGL